MSNFTFEIGENIKFYRKQRNMTLKELGCKVGITESTMQKYETGQIKRIDVEAVQKISSALDISPELIVKWDEEKAAMSPIPSLYSAIREQRIKLNSAALTLAYLASRVQEKYSVSHGEMRIYNHRLYEIHCCDFPEKFKKDNFVINGKHYYWMSMSEMEKDKNIQEKNLEVVDFVKEYIK